MDIGSLFFTTTATVEPYAGAGPTGDLYGAPQTVRGFLDDGLVLREQTERGEELVSRTKFYTDLGNAALFPNQSRVTVNGKVAQVTAARRRDASGFGGPSHLEVDLT